MWKQLLPAFRMTLLMTVLTGLIYPAAITGLCQVLFKDQANGNSTLIGQSFSSAKYFHPRPSNAGANGYDGLASGGFNDGPTSKKLSDRVTAAVAKFHEENPDFHDQIPADAVTASASGLDPDISPANAEAQSFRVAKARGRSLEVIRQMIAAHTKARDLGFLGEPRVNVLELNLALDGK
jgi:K+-transporting ATPase ATPase C chain